MSPAILVGGGAALAAAAVIGFQQIQLGNLRDRVSDLEREKGEATQAIEQWKAQAESCSTATAKLKAQGAAQRRVYEEGLQRALQGRAAAQELARKILMDERPAGMDECTAARAELDAEVDRRHP